MISIRMLKICGKSICRPLELIFSECISNGVFPSEWKKGNVVPIHKKNDRQQTFFSIVTHSIIAYHISLANFPTNYCNNNLLILDVKQLNKIMKLYYFYALKAL